MDDVEPLMARGATWRWSWILGLAGTVAVAFGTQFYAFSVLLTEEAAGAEFSTSVLSIAYGGSVLAGGGLAFWVGRLADRHGVRWLIAAGSLLGASGLVLVSASGEPWQVIAASMALVGAGGAMTFYEPAFVAVDQWYGPSSRAKALAILTVIGGLAGPIFLPLTAGLVDAFGWRPATRVLAAVLAGTGVAVAAFLLPSRAGPRVAATPVRSLRSLATDARFVFFTAATFLTFGVMQAVFFHRIAVFEEAGFALGTITAWAAVSGVVSFVGRWGSPFVADRVGPVRIHSLAVAGIGAAVLLMLVDSAIAMYGHFVAFGVALGAVLPLRALVMARWYSGPGYGAVMGTQWSITAIAGASGATVIGILRDAVGGYELPMTLVALAAGAAAVLTALSGRARSTGSD